ncbi:MAG: hypothetical protein ACXABY_08100 [Candidatus Thorarchaeota archaeon]
MSTSERLSALLDAVYSKSPIDRLIDRLKEERKLGYYSEFTGDDLFRVVIKWAEKCQQGED